MTTPMSAFCLDVARSGVQLDEAIWAEIKTKLEAVRFARDTIMERQTAIAERWIFICRGIAASRQTHLDGEVTIARFFERGQICANLTSAWTRQYATDDLIAMTDVTAVAIPNDLFQSELLNGGPLGLYFRLKAMETLCFDKEVISAKTRFDTETRYRFLEHNYESVLEKVRQRDIAAFLGITPQGLSRFKRKRKDKVNSG